MSSRVDPKKVWCILSKVPEGKVITYGKLAEMVDARGSARIIGNILKQLPVGCELPWYRVVNSKGLISFLEGTPRHKRQRDRLKLERVLFSSGKIDLQKYLWNGE